MTGPGEPERDWESCARPAPPPEDADDADEAAAAERAHAWWLRAAMVRLLAAMCFAMGMLAGALLAGFGMPPVWWAPVTLLLTSGLMLLLRDRRPR